MSLRQLAPSAGTPLLFFALAAITTLFVACGPDSGDSSGGGRLRVVSTVAPITSLVENIGGTRIELDGLVPEGVNSHTYEPPVSDVRKLSRADLIVLNGLQLEEPILELAKANKKAGAVVLLLGDETITPQEHRFDFSFPRSEGKPNPHLWPDPALAMEYAQLIHRELVFLDPENKGYYDANLQTLMARLEKLDEAMRTAVETVPPQNRRLLTYHDSWAYWADRYGFQVVGAIQPSDFSEPSAGEMARLIEQIRREQLPAVFGSEVFPSPVLETIARETGARYVDDLRDDDLPGQPGDALHSYIGLMVQNMRIMLPALGGDASAMDTVETGPVFNDGPGAARYPQ